MNEQRNFILAIALSVVILIGYQYYVEVTSPPPPPPQENAQNAPGQPGGSEAPQVGGQASGDLIKLLDPQMARANALEKSERIQISSPRLSGSLALTGARLDDLALLKYRETKDKASPAIKLFSPVGSDKPYYAMFGWTAAPGTQLALPDGNSVWTADKNELTPASPVTLRWDNGAGLLFTRHIAMDENYMFTVTQSVENNSGQPVTLYPYGLISRTGIPVEQGLYILHEGPLGVFEDTLDEIDYDDLDDKAEEARSTGGWVGITDKYWLAALAPDSAHRFTAHMKRVPSPDENPRYQVDYLRDSIDIPAGGKAEVSDYLFAGAKEVDQLEYYRDHLKINKFDLAIDFGILYFLTKPLFKVMAFFFGAIGNFGVAILLLTLCLRIVLFPLANKSYKSMNKMKALQPELLVLRERYSDDKQKLNQAMMDLYKKEKVNPAAGCLPILVQIPIFFALYKVLLVTIEMRHAPFFGWIQDLSAPDPTTLFNLFGLIPWEPPQFLMIGIWPLAMGGSMYLQQMMNPQPADPIQAKLFQFMPLFFMFLLASFPAGLVVYWTCNNVLSMTQQWVIMKRMGVPIGGGKKKT